MTKKILIGLGVLGVIIMGFNLFLGSSGSENSSPNDEPVVTTGEDGRQVVDIWAKGGYSPTRVSATGGQETILRFTTSNTYDCSAAMTIPSLGVSEFLEPTATKDIVVPADKATGNMLITCSMGMYSSTVSFS